MTSLAPAPRGEEPPSGIQGKGTAQEPFDQGNAPENAPASEEPPSGIQGPGTAKEPYDQGNAPENVSKDEPTAVSSTSKSSTTGKANGDQKNTEDRGRDPLRAPSSARIEERSISPGTLPDGTHAKTSGERGENYEPGKLSKLKGKLPFGKH